MDVCPGPGFGFDFGGRDTAFVFFGGWVVTARCFGSGLARCDGGAGVGRGFAWTCFAHVRAPFTISTIASQTCRTELRVRMRRPAQVMANRTTNAPQKPITRLRGNATSEPTAPPRSYTSSIEEESETVPVMR